MAETKGRVIITEEAERIAMTKKRTARALMEIDAVFGLLFLVFFW